MRLPDGRLVRSRVVTDPRTALVDALDRETTGYAVLEPQGSLLLDGDGHGIVTFERGVPVVAYHTGTERGGPPALADLATEGPYRLELFAVDPGALERVHVRDSFRVPPGMAAERLVGDSTLAERTREAASPAPGGTGVDDDAGRSRDSRVQSGDAPTDVGRGEPDAGDDTADRQVGAVEAFLDDEEKVAAIREEAREEAEARAEEWGF
jgi:hypothetical protein